MSTHNVEGVPLRDKASHRPATRRLAQVLFVAAVTLSILATVAARVRDAAVVGTGTPSLTVSE